MKTYTCYDLFFRCLLGNYNFRNKNVSRADIEQGNSVSKIDMISRYLFPGSFIFFHAFYWSWYWDTASFEMSLV
jgi:hypothetical protein